MADSNSLNSFTILGFVGQDARGFTSKKTSRKFTVIDICTQEKYRNKKEPKIVWHQVQIWGTKMAPWAETGVKKGMMVLAKGRIDNHYIICQGRDCQEKHKVDDYKVEEFIILRGKKLEDPAPAQTVDPKTQASPMTTWPKETTGSPLEEDPY